MGAAGRGRRIHDLRHTAACLWLARGVDVSTVQSWMGHASIAAVAEHTGASRSTIYRNPEPRAVIEHHRQTAPDGTITAITDELATLRQAVQTLADTVRQHDTQLRRLARD